MEWSEIRGGILRQHYTYGWEQCKQCGCSEFRIAVETTKIQDRTAYLICSKCGDSSVCYELPPEGKK